MDDLKLVIVCDGGIVQGVYSDRLLPYGDVVILDVSDWVADGDLEDETVIEAVFNGGGKNDASMKVKALATRDDFLCDPEFVKQIWDKVVEAWKED